MRTPGAKASVSFDTSSLFLLFSLAAAELSVPAAFSRSMSNWDAAYDGKVRRWRVQCGFECQGERCQVVGESGLNPEAKKAREVGIFCKKHAREDGRTMTGRNKDLRNYVMTVSDEDKKRAREDVKQDRGKPKKKKNTSPEALRKGSVCNWLGSVPFQECSAFHSKMVLDELRVTSRSSARFGCRGRRRSRRRSRRSARCLPPSGPAPIAAGSSAIGRGA